MIPEEILYEALTAAKKSEHTISHRCGIMLINLLKSHSDYMGLVGVGQCFAWHV